MPPSEDEGTLEEDGVAEYGKYDFERSAVKRVSTKEVASVDKRDVNTG